jgi:hypothetical protein
MYGSQKKKTIVTTSNEQTSLDGIEASLLEEDELVHLHVQRECGDTRHGCGHCDGEVHPIGEVGAQRLHERAQMMRAQALTWIETSEQKTQSEKNSSHPESQVLQCFSSISKRPKSKMAHAWGVIFRQWNNNIPPCTW